MSPHEDDEEHGHDGGGDRVDPLWKLDNVELTTVGVDVGSSTSHFMFARIVLHRQGHALSSRFVVVERTVLWRSPIYLTPYRGELIDATRLEALFLESFPLAGLQPTDVDTGAVILTGVALQKANARAIAERFAGESGRFVCASAGHNLEALMAAHGSGAAALSVEHGGTLLHVDIGGGTTKLALIQSGEVLATAAIAAGGRLILRGQLEPEAEARAVRRMADGIVAAIGGAAPADLLVTPPLPAEPRPDRVSFSGGVSEYLYGRETREFGDVGQQLAAAVRDALNDGRIALPVVEPREGIRATVVGAAEFTVQVSGSTIAVTDRAVLPLRGLPVVYPRLGTSDDLDADAVAAAIDEGARRVDAALHDRPVALAFSWRGDPTYARVRALAEGIARASAQWRREGRPLVVLFEADVAGSVGAMLRDELGVREAIVALDGVELRELDYVDLGELIPEPNVVPVVVKSLLFSR